MKRSFSLLILMLIVGLVAGAVQAQTEMSDKDRLIKITQTLELQPFHEKAKDLREWAMFYVIQTKDVSVIVCTNAITLAMDKKYKYSSELLTQYTLGMAAFKLVNPDKAKDEDDAQLAGIESMLKAYEAMVKEKPKAQSANVDILVTKRNNSELKKHLDENRCKDDKK